MKAVNVSENTLIYLKNCSVEPSYRSDHSMVVLDLEFHPFVRGKGLWKFNNSLLYDSEYIKTVKDKISDIKKQYAALVYNFDNIDIINIEDIHFRINMQLFLETLLMEIRGKTISYSSFKKRESEKKEFDLRNRIMQLEAETDEHSINELENKKHELETLRKEKMKGKLIRSRAQWVEEGEKPSGYFCGLESKNFVSKIIPKVEKDDGQIITDQFEILKEVKLFYENLYQCKESYAGCNLNDLKKDLYQKQYNILTSDEQDSLEGKITIHEAGVVLKKMKNNKTPGSDGFSAEFFKFFWKDFQYLVVESLNYGFDIGELSITQKQGIITCLPKGNKPRHFLKNWRPISLLNTVYKIGSAVIANRFKKVLDKLIDSDQTGFISGRYIGENIRLIYDIMQYTEEQDIPGLLLLIDFEKAFDSISWEFLHCVLKFFNFGESIIKWVEVFYSNIKSAVIQGGNLSEFFHIGRGCRQGDPLSPYLFILCAEILAIKIRGNKDICGIHVLQTEHKMSQFADDTSLILDGDEKSLSESLIELDWFAKMSGLNINFSKTQVIWIGNKKYSSDILCQDKNLSWGETSFKLLGVNFDVDLDKIVKLNYFDRIVQIKSLLKQWSKRNLTVIGRITVIKSLVLPILNHLIISLPNPDEETIKKINDLMFTFIWNSPVNKVKKDILCKEYSEGGLKMIDLNVFINALKSTWIRRFCEKNCKWQNIFMSYIDKNKLFSCGGAYIKNLYLKIKNYFWKDVLRSWEMLIDRERDTDWEYFLSNPIWLNNLIKIEDKPPYFKDWFEHGIHYINDLYNFDGSFFTIEQLHQHYGINIDVMKYNSLRSAVKTAAKFFTKGTSILCRPFIPSVFKNLIRSKKGSKDMYNVLVKNNVCPSGQKKWSELLGDPNIEWNCIFNLPFVVTKNTKLQWLQYRINHYILTTNKLLFKMKIVDDPYCTFCHTENETIEHLIWNCNIVQDFLHDVENWFLSHGTSIPITKLSFIFGDVSKCSKNDPKNIIFFNIKQYIYSTRCFKNNLSIVALKCKLQDMYKIEKMLAVKNKCITQFNIKWSKFQNIFN